MKNNNLSQILYLIQSKKIRVVEKLAGNNPKSSVSFFTAYHNTLEYKALNLIDQTKVYFERAANHAQNIGFDINAYKRSVNYMGGINIVNKKLSTIIQKYDVVIYWGGAMNCIRPFGGGAEQQYKDIVDGEYQKAKDNGNTDFLEVHRNIRQRMNDEIPSERDLLTDDVLEEIILDDLSCLSDQGVLITNTLYDFDRIKDLMLRQQFFGKNYILKDNGVGLRDYESQITVWSK